MKFYFDVIETFIKTIAVEADNIEQAQRRADGAYKRNEFEIDRTYPDQVDFKNATTEVEEFFQTGDCAEEEIETFNCNNVAWDDIKEGYVCPVCGEYVASTFEVKCIDYPLPKYCHECGAKLYY